MTHKTVITYGTFDMFHIGHLRLIKRLRDYGDRVIVGVSTDEFNKKKGKNSVIPYNQRAEIVQSIQGVDLVIAEDDWNQKRDDIINYNAHKLIMGDDWLGKFDELEDVCDVIYLSRTDGISSTEIKKVLGHLDIKLKEDINNLFLILESIKRELC